MKRYALPGTLPTESIHDVLFAVQKRMGLIDKENAYQKFLMDFREGKLGKVFLDDTTKL